MPEQRDRKIISLFAVLFAVIFLINFTLDFFSHGFNMLMGYAIPLSFLEFLNLIAPKN